LTALSLYFNYYFAFINTVSIAATGTGGVCVQQSVRWHPDHVQQWCFSQNRASRSRWHLYSSQVAVLYSQGEERA